MPGFRAGADFLPGPVLRLGPPWLKEAAGRPLRWGSVALPPVLRLWWSVSRPVAPGQERIGAHSVGVESSLPGLNPSLLRELVFRREAAVVEAGQGSSLDADFQRSFHGANHGEIVGRGQSEGLAGVQSPARAPDTVGIGVHGIGNVEVHHVADFRNINAVGGDVRGHQQVVLALAEPI